MSLLQTLDIYPHQMVNVGNYGGNFDKNWNICELTGLVFFFSKWKPMPLTAKYSPKTSYLSGKW